MAYYYSPFRKEYTKPLAKGCPFCKKSLMKEQSVSDGKGHAVENEHYRWLINWFPKVEGHTLIIPKRHILDLKEETGEEVLSRHNLMIMAKQTITQLYPGAGIEIFLQSGDGSDASVPHLHWHVTPSLREDPIRGFNKLGQFCTEEAGKEKVIIFPVPIRLARDILKKELQRFL